MPGKALLGRYDRYPDPRGKESQQDPKMDPPPTNAPVAPNQVEVQRVVCRRLTRKTNCSGADLNMDARTQRNKEKIRDLRLRVALTGSAKRAPALAVTEVARCNASDIISDDAALQGYISEPPKLARLMRKSRPPEGYIRHGPKDVHEAIKEYLTPDPPGIESREEYSLRPKARQNQEAVRRFI